MSGAAPASVDQRIHFLARSRWWNSPFVHRTLGLRAWAAARGVIDRGAFILLSGLPHSTVSPFMTANKIDVASAPTSPRSAAPVPPQTSSVRLVILLGLLATVIGAYAYDLFVARPACEAADKKIQ